MLGRHTDPVMPGLVLDKPGHDERMGASASAARITRMKFLNELAAELPIEAGSEFERNKKKIPAGRFWDRFFFRNAASQDNWIKESSRSDPPRDISSIIDRT
jgi:hypothetical protein